MAISREERAVGCMIGAAYGDSLGAATEFSSSKTIKKRFGEHGISELVSVYGEVGNITDDTQMAIATAEGILNTPKDFANDEKLLMHNIWQSYIKWFDTQLDDSESRAPGSTCLSALASNKMGTLRKPLNKSPGCGAIMRAHPIGIAYGSNRNTFRLGVLSGVITHGHPDAYIPSGFLSMLTGEIMDGQEFENALEHVTEKVKKVYKKKSKGTITALDRAVSGYKNKGDTFEIIDKEVGGGGGWHGHDALAIGIFAVLRANGDPIESVKIAANHSGDTDSTASIAGAIAGALHGPQAFFDTLDEQNVQLEHEEYLGILATSLAMVSS